MQVELESSLVAGNAMVASLHVGCMEEMKSGTEPTARGPQVGWDHIQDAANQALAVHAERRDASWDTVLEIDHDRGEEKASTRPGFELATYAIPAGCQGMDHSSGWPGVQENFSNVTNAALRPLLDQLPLGAALVTEYVFSPKGDGAISLECRLCVEVPDDVSAQLAEELAVCLATLSNHFGFRTANPRMVDTRFDSTKTLVVRPLAASCLPRSGTMGFASTEETDVAIRLPIPTLPPTGEQAPDQRIGAGNLSQFLKAARALRRSLRIRISLVRERLPGTAAEALARLLRENPQLVGVSDLDVPRIGQMMLYRQVQGWTERSDAILRIKIEAEGSEGQTPIGSLLRMLAAEMFPGLRVEIVSRQSLPEEPLATIDLSDAIPLAGPLPPLFPPPAMLEALDFPRHYDNPSVSLPSDGLMLGHAQLGGFEHPVRIAEGDRSRHVYMLGATGTGKSTLLLNMVRQDMEAGRGIALIDPHGDLFEQVLASVPPSRLCDVHIIDPDDESHAVGLNPLDFDGAPSLTKVNRVINDLMDIFTALWNMREVAGPAFEQYFRNSFLLASTAPEDQPPEGLPKGPPTLLTAIEVMRNRDYRHFLLERCASSFLGGDIGGEVERFFHSAHAVNGEHSFANWVPYVTSKLSRFTSNPRLRRILCLPRRTLNFRMAIDRGEIILVKLDKGHLGDLDTRMIGMLITKYLFHAALSRSDVASSARRPFHLYLDEFQNFVTNDIPDILSEARKFGLHLTLAHQTLGQLKSEGQSPTLDAVLGNVATRLFFRVGLKEAKQLEAEFLPHFDAQAMAALPDRYVLARVLVYNKPSPPFVFRTADILLPAAEQRMKQDTSDVG